MDRDTQSTPASAAAHASLFPAIALVAIGLAGYLASSGWPLFGLGAALDDWFAAPYGPDGAHAVRELAASVFALVASVGLGWGIVVLLRRDPAVLQREIDRTKLLAGTVRGMVLLLLISGPRSAAGWGLRAAGSPSGGLPRRASSPVSASSPCSPSSAPSSSAASSAGTAPHVPLASQAANPSAG